MSDTPRPPSLRDELIKAGMALLEEGGTANLTLRRAAARAGVSHAAPAHHFAGLPGLLTAIAARAFTTFVATMEDRIARAPADPRARLHATCQGYLDFAADHAGLFHLMFLAGEVDRSDPEILPPSALAYDLLRRACLPYSANGAPDVLLETAVWSLVHGYATLGLGRGRGSRPVPIVPPFSACLDLLLTDRPLAAPAASG